MEPSLASPDLFRHLARLRREVCAIGYLDHTGHLLGMRHFPLSDLGAARISLRAVARDAVAFEAHAVVMAHNHPSGDASPSQHDIQVTRSIERALDALGVALSDHFVITYARAFSFRAAGLL